MASTNVSYMLLLQIYHFFEVIAPEVYKLAGSLTKYRLVPSVLVTINVVALYLLSGTCPRATLWPLSAR